MSIEEPSDFAEFMDWASDEESCWSQADWDTWFATDEGGNNDTVAQETGAVESKSG